MRVNAGRYRGTSLRCGRGPFYRPTAQIVKGSIFDTLGSDVTGARFLDLFAGSGAIGIEALSRGAKQAVFVEQDRRILKALRTNLQRCRITADQAIVLGHDVFRFVDRLKKGIEFFDHGGGERGLPAAGRRARGTDYGGGGRSARAPQNEAIRTDEDILFQGRY